MILNKRCPICDNGFRFMVNRTRGEVIKIPQQSFYSNKEKEIEFLVHKRCKKHIRTSNLPGILKKLEEGE